MADNLDEFYRDEYSRFIETGFVGFVGSLTHVSMEFGRRKDVCESSYRILELGAGGGQHVKFVKQNYSEYVLTDLRPENLPNSKERVIVEPLVISAESLPYADSSFDRLIATCLFAHLSSPQKAFEECIRVLKHTGELTIYVPCEPGILLRALQTLITNPKKRRQGIKNPTLMHYRDHIQTYLRLKSEVISLEKKFKVKRYPFPFLPWNFNLWAVFKIYK